VTISSAASHVNGFLRPAPPILERAWESTASSLEERGTRSMHRDRRRARLPMRLRNSADLGIGHILHASITPDQAALATLVCFLDFDLQHQPLTKADAVSKLSGRPFGDRPKPKPSHYSHLLSLPLDGNKRRRVNLPSSQRSSVGMDHRSRRLLSCQVTTNGPAGPRSGALSCLVLADADQGRLAGPWSGGSCEAEPLDVHENERRRITRAVHPHG
jgi:hypothetical protein